MPTLKLSKGAHIVDDTLEIDENGGITIKGYRYIGSEEAGLTITRGTDELVIEGEDKK